MILYKDFKSKSFKKDITFPADNNITKQDALQEQFASSEKVGNFDFFFFFQRKKDLFALARVAFSAADLYQKASACNLRGVIIDQ